MGKIFYIIGPSATGKDTIFKRILEDSQGELRTIIMYTTRPIRVKEVEGISYHFTTEDELELIREAGNLIELRAYNTYHGIWKYFTVNDEQISSEDIDYLMIGTLDSYLKTKEFFGKGRVVPLLITVDAGIRLERALRRERKQEKPKYEEMCRRFLADTKDFSHEKLKSAGITKKFRNDNLENCVREIVHYIQIQD